MHVAIVTPYFHAFYFSEFELGSYIWHIDMYCVNIHFTIRRYSNFQTCLNFIDFNIYILEVM